MRGGFMDFLAISGCDTSLYHSQGGATELSLCDPDREFGICVNTQIFSKTTEPELLQAFARLVSISSNFLSSHGMTISLTLSKQ